MNTNFEFKSIQKKLVAAVAMVLVAAIMVVSSSYAWFTLSTAPEVTGITTSVGSNGNLEMALNVTGNLGDIVNAMGAGTGSAVNKYWGNLVDLSDPAYGLSNISLAPGRLNIAVTPGDITTKEATVDDASQYNVGDTYGGGKITVVDTENNKITYEITAQNYSIDFEGGYYLQTAVYGTDGRVSKLETNGQAGVYNGAGWVSAGAAGAADKYGVRGVGTVSGLTDAQIALRDAKNLVTDAKANTLNLASQSLQKDSVNLANIIIAHTLNESATFNGNDRTNVVTAINNLKKVTAGLQEALDAVVVAVGVSQGLVRNNIEVTWTATSVEATDGNKSITWTSLSSLHAELIKSYKELVDMNKLLTDAEAAMPAEAASYTFDQISAPMDKILKTNDFKIGGKTINEHLQSGDKLDIGWAIMDGEPIEIVGGFYAGIAKFVDNYTVNTKIWVNGTFAGQGINKEFPVTMKTNVAAPVGATESQAGTSYYLVYFVNQLAGIVIEGEGGADAPISDLYAYIIDLAFRTNAADSYLQLQTDGTSRVGNDTTTALQGGGSYMTFDIKSTGYTPAQLVQLMSAIRVVLFDTDNGKIYGMAALDLTEYTNEQKTNPTAFNARTSIKAPLYLYSYSFDANEVCTLGVKLDSNAILALQQNQATALSSMVYLDGDKVDNSMVGISGNTVEGQMNLQFSSSAELIPMNYTFTEQKLATPVLALSNDGVLTINAVENATTYTISANGIELYSGAAVGTVNLAEQLAAHNITEGSIEITVTASAAGYTASSAKVTYTITQT